MSYVKSSYEVSRVGVFTRRIPIGAGADGANRATGWIPRTSTSGGETTPQLVAARNDPTHKSVMFFMSRTSSNVSAERENARKHFLIACASGSHRPSSLHADATTAPDDRAD